MADMGVALAGAGIRDVAVQYLARAFGWCYAGWHNTTTRFLMDDKGECSDVSYHGVCASAERRLVALSEAFPPPMPDRDGLRPNLRW